MLETRWLLFDLQPIAEHKLFSDILAIRVSP